MQNLSTVFSFCYQVHQVPRHSPTRHSPIWHSPTLHSSTLDIHLLWLSPTLTLGYFEHSPIRRSPTRKLYLLLRKFLYAISSQSRKVTVEQYHLSWFCFSQLFRLRVGRYEHTAMPDIAKEEYKIPISFQHSPKT